VAQLDSAFVWGTKGLAVQVCPPRLMKILTKKTQAEIKRLRRLGKSHREIAQHLHVGLGSAFLYAHPIRLTKSQHQHLVHKSYEKGFGKLSKEERHLASVKGGINNAKHPLRKYSREQLLSLLKNFYTQNGRIPTKRDFVPIYGSFFRVFGTWNNAIKEAGFSPNPVLFAKKYLANDGHKCDSLAEKIIDDWLFARKIQHERNVHYLNTKFTADFKVGETLIEFFGLHGQLKGYDLLMRRKMKIIQQHHLKLISIFPKDIFPILHLDTILRNVRITTTRYGIQN
jgi:hypothetical protein